MQGINDNENARMPVEKSQSSSSQLKRTITPIQQEVPTELEFEHSLAYMLEQQMLNESQVQEVDQSYRLEMPHMDEEIKEE